MTAVSMVLAGGCLEWSEDSQATLDPLGFLTFRCGVRKRRQPPARQTASGALRPIRNGGSDCQYERQHPALAYRTEQMANWSECVRSAKTSS
jgi:hypothetical protein